MFRKSEPIGYVTSDNTKCNFVKLPDTPFKTEHLAPLKYISYTIMQGEDCLREGDNDHAKKYFEAALKEIQEFLNNI